MKKEFLLAALCASCANKNIADDTPNNITQEHIDKLLAEVAQKPAPETVVYHALCYSPAAPIDRAEYVCPICGAKTIHTKSVADAVSWEVDSNRRYIEKVKNLGLDASLDERAFCDSCRKNTELKKGSTDVYLVVRMNGRMSHTLLKDNNDWKKLIAFLEGKNVWENMDGKRPLKPELPRIRELLGLTGKTEPIPETVEPAPVKMEHIVQSGETLSSIARAYSEKTEKRITINEIISINEIQDPSVIKVGQKIFIPVK